MTASFFTEDIATPMPQNTPPQPRKYPQQTRSQIRVDAIHQACLKLLRKQNGKPLTTQDIADMAGINIASVYQYFPNKDAVLASVYDRELGQLTDLTARRFTELQRLSQRSLEQTLHDIIELEADQLSALHSLNPEFFAQYSQSYDIHNKVDKKTQEMKNPSWKQWLPAFLVNHQDRLRKTDVETLSFFVRHTMKGMLEAALNEDPQLLNNTEFRAELLAMILRYLLDDVPSTTHDSINSTIRATDS